MSYSIIPLPFFDKQLKRLVKKYPSLKKEYMELVRTLADLPMTGTPIGNNCYKIRLAIASKGRGKVGVARVITLIQVINAKVYLVSIYDKSEQADISDKDLQELTKHLPERN
jgi:mRNA-degrading endonuclease RelE of RelBE toxin-antitoxin system